MASEIGRRDFLAGAAAIGFASPASLMSSAAVAQDGAITWNEPLPSTLDPHLVVSTSGQFIQLNLYDTLYRYVGNPAEFVPWLARSHTVSDDALTWTISLRDDAKFHSGAPVTAEDVVYSFRRLLAVGGGYANVFKPILQPENIQAGPGNSVVFKLDKRYSPFLSALPIVAIMDSVKMKANEKSGDWGKAFLSAEVAGSGTYRMRAGSFRPLEAIDLDIFPEHFLGVPANAIKLARIRFIKEPSTELLALLKGEIDATISYIGAEQAEKIAQNPSTYVSRDEGLRAFCVRLHNQRAPFDNVHFRRALSYAFNYDGVITGLLKNTATRVNQPLPSNIWGYNPSITGYSYDLAKARAELQKARDTGVKDLGREIKIYTDQARQDPVLIAQIFQSELRKLGLKTVLVPSLFDQSAALTTRAETSPDIWMHHTSAYFVDPENWIGQMYDSTMHGSWKASSWYKNPKVDALLAQAREEPDQAKRSALYQSAAAIIVEDAADIWVYNPLQMRGLTKRIKTFKYCPIGAGGELRQIGLG